MKVMTVSLFPTLLAQRGEGRFVSRVRDFHINPDQFAALILSRQKIMAHLLTESKALTTARSKGTYVCSFHASSWLDYLRRPHSLSLSTLDEIANHYWPGALVEDAGLTFLNERWREPPVIVALFQGMLKAVTLPTERLAARLCLTLRNLY